MNDFHHKESVNIQIPLLVSTLSSGNIALIAFLFLLTHVVAFTSCFDNSRYSPGARPNKSKKQSVRVLI